MVNHFEGFVVDLQNRYEFLSMRLFKSDQGRRVNNRVHEINILFTIHIRYFSISNQLRKLRMVYGETKIRCLRV